MKHHHYIIITVVLLLASPSAHAGWFSKAAPDPVPDLKAKIASLENQLSAQTATNSRWQIAAGSLAVVSVLSLIIGTALGSLTRNHYDYGTGRRMGPPPTTQKPTHNSRKPRLMGKAHQRNGTAALPT